MQNIFVEVTEHVCLRYIERFNQSLMAITNREERLKKASMHIKAIIENAHYVSDNENGVLLHSPLFKCNLIVRNRKLITLYYPNKKTREREKKYKKEVVSNECRI